MASLKQSTEKMVSDMEEPADDEYDSEAFEIFCYHILWMLAGVPITWGLYQFYGLSFPTLISGGFTLIPLVGWILYLFPPLRPWLRNELPKKLTEEEEVNRRYWQRMRPLGLGAGVLWCLGANNSQSEWYFNPPEDEDIRIAFQRFLERFWEHFYPEAKGNQFNGMAIVASGLLICGRLEMVDYILANLPPERMELDHGCGMCNVAAFNITAKMLPLPSELCSYFDWVEGSRTAKKVGDWFTTHRSVLVWDSDQKRFVIDSSSEAQSNQ